MDRPIPAPVISKASRGRRLPLGYSSIFYLLYNYYIKLVGGMQGKSKVLIGFSAFLCIIFIQQKRGQLRTNGYETSPLNIISRGSPVVHPGICKLSCIVLPGSLTSSRTSHPAAAVPGCAATPPGAHRIP